MPCEDAINPIKLYANQNLLRMEMHTCVDVLNFHCCAYTGDMIMTLLDIHNTLGSGVHLLIHDNSARIFSNSAAHFLAGVTMATSLGSWHRAPALP